MKIPVFFSNKMVSHADSFSPSDTKPAVVVKHWLDLDLPIHVKLPVMADLTDLSRAHNRAYVAGVLSRAFYNGFSNKSLDVARSLPWTSGSMFSAAYEAVHSGLVACSPSSGFHHAGWDFGGDYCTFNGLMVAAAALHNEKLVEKVGIIDCDMHYGNGTKDIIKYLHASRWIRHFTNNNEWNTRSDAPAFFVALRKAITKMADCDLVLYKAGADSYVDDPLGGYLTVEQLRERDAVVFQEFARLGIPIAWNLAGGYTKQPDGSIPTVLEIHTNTLKECIKAYQKVK
ncbi:hypothetical protein MUP59_11460 [Candidatus Bathyarchaeota archaeon]|nr:hypothetical protein [Candidatus Bathyarchaeota archaeon]